MMPLDEKPGDRQRNYDLTPEDHVKYVCAKFHSNLSNSCQVISKIFQN